MRLAWVKTTKLIDPANSELKVQGWLRSDDSWTFAAMNDSVDYLAVVFNDLDAGDLDSAHRLNPGNEEKFDFEMEAMRSRFGYGYAATSTPTRERM